MYQNEVAIHVIFLVRFSHVIIDKTAFYININGQLNVDFWYKCIDLIGVVIIFSCSFN